MLCEYRAGIRLSRRYKQNLARLQAALTVLRLWPTDEETAVEFAELFRELRVIPSHFAVDFAPRLHGKLQCAPIEAASRDPHVFKPLKSWLAFHCPF